MKKLILCEGKNDGEFFRQTFSELGINLDHIKIFGQDEREIKKGLKHAETIMLDKFKEPSCPYKFLVKSESGKDKAIYLFSGIIANCLETGIRTFLMLDLDEQPAQKVLDKIQSKVLNKRYSGQLKLEQKEITKNNIISVYNVDVKTKAKQNQEKIGSFCLILWKASLEKEINRLASDQNDSDIVTGISRLVKLREVKEIFSSILQSREQ